jgi:hypothetical protein
MEGQFWRVAESPIIPGAAMGAQGGILFAISGA